MLKQGLKRTQVS